MEPTGAFAPAVLERWRRRENLLPGAFLAALAVVGWAYTVHQARGSGMGEATGPALFLAGWATMMVAMMLPATLPLFLLYRTLSRHRSGAGVAALLAGYLLVWIAAGLPVYAYSLLMEGMSPLLAVLPGLLLVAGGIYQFTALKRTCHVRCGSPLFFLMQRWRAGAAGALQLGVLHGVDCLGCCAGLMAGLVALGMMNPAWMLTAAVIVFAEKTLPGGHRLVRPLGVLMIAGGTVILGTALPGVWEAV